MIPQSVCSLCGGLTDSGHICPRPNRPVDSVLDRLAAKDAEIAALKAKIAQSETEMLLERMDTNTTIAELEAKIERLVAAGDAL